jgi:hypothetical protein
MTHERYTLDRKVRSLRLTEFATVCHNVNQHKCLDIKKCRNHEIVSFSVTVPLNENVWDISSVCNKVHSKLKTSKPGRIIIIIIIII